MTTTAASVRSAFTDAARTVLATAGPAVVRIGRQGGRGCGVVVAPGAVLTNAHNLRDRTTEVSFADGRSAQASVTAVDGDGDLVVRGGRHRRHRTGQLGRRARPSRAPSSTRWPGPRTGAPASPSGWSAASTGSSGGHAAGASPARWNTPPRSGEARRAARSWTRTAAWSASTRPAWGKGSPSRSRRTPTCRHVSTRSSAASRPSAARSASGWPPRRSRPACARRSAFPSEPVCWSGPSTPTGPAARAGVQVGDLVVGAGGAEVTTVDDLHQALDAATGALELRLVRGTDERHGLGRLRRPRPDGRAALTGLG